MEQFIVCYFALCFVEGYRIVEKIGDNVFLLSQMFCQHASDHASEGSSKLHAMYRLLSVNFVENDLNENL